jgi:tetratricopeptide (TPR) repeat protein
MKKRYMWGIAVSLLLFSESMKAIVFASYEEESSARTAANAIKKILDSENISIDTKLEKRGERYLIVSDREPDSEERAKIERALASVLGVKSRKRSVKKSEKSPKKISRSQKAVKLYKSGKYEEAYEILRQLRLQRLGSPRLNFYLGRSAFETGHYKEALEAYEKIMKSGRDDSRVKLEHARTLTMLNEYEKAKKELSEVLKRPLPPRVKANVERYLSLLEKKSAKNIVTAAIMVGVGYDDNIYNHTYLGSTHYGESEVENNNTRVSDSFHREILSLRHLYIFDNREWAWDSSVLFFNRTYRDHDDVDVLQPSLMTGLRYSDKNKSVYIPIVYNRLWFGGEDYMEVEGVRPVLSYLIDDRTSLDLKAVYLAKRYVQSEERERDSKLFGGRVGINRLLSKERYIRGEVAAYGERRKRGDRKDISYNMFSVGAQYSTPLFAKTNLYTYGKFEYYDYLKNDPNLNDRKDRRFRLDMDLSREISESVSLEARYSYTRNDSTVNLYEFRKNVMSINLLATF